MNLALTIAKEHSKAQRDKVVSYIGNNPKRFAELVDVFLCGPYRITQRASWSLSTCVQNHPALVKPHLKKIISYLHQPDQHDAVKRNVLRLLQYVEIPDRYQGEVADVCFQFLSDVKEPVAIRAFSITLLTGLACQLPELKNELIPLIEQRMPYEKPAFVSRGNKALKQLRKPAL